MLPSQSHTSDGAGKELLYEMDGQEEWTPAVSGEGPRVIGCPVYSRRLLGVAGKATAAAAAYDEKLWLDGG